MAVIAPSVRKDFFSVDIWFLLGWNIGPVSEPGRYGDKPVRHGTRKGGFDGFVEAGQDESADDDECGGHQNPFATRARIRAGSVSPVERPTSFEPLKTISVL